MKWQKEAILQYIVGFLLLLSVSSIFYFYSWSIWNKLEVLYTTCFYFFFPEKVLLLFVDPDTRGGSKSYMYKLQ